MSISSSSEAGSPPPALSPQPSSSFIENRVQANLLVIQELAEAQLLQISERGAALFSQIFSISERGHDDEVIAKALSVSQVSLRTLLEQDLVLTEEQYRLVISTCRDLEESSGSSSTVLLKQRKRAAESESNLQEQLSLTPSRETTTSSKEESLLMKLLTETSTLSSPTLKHSSYDQEEVAQQKQIEQPLKKQKISPKDLYKDVQPPSSQTSQENDLKIITFLLDTILEKLPHPYSSSIVCPNRSSKEITLHSCPLCSWTKQFFGKRKSALTKQLEIFLECTSKEVLAEALVKLNLKEKQVFINKRLTSIHAAYLIAACGIGSKICLPNVANPASQAGLYQCLEKVVSLGIQHPLSQTIKELWETSSGLYLPSKREENATVAVLRGGTLCEVSPATLQTIFSGLKNRPIYQRKEGQRYISDSQIKFLARLTFLTLRALLESPLGEPFTEQSGPNRVIPWNVVQHVYSLILVSSPKRRVAILPSRASLGASEDIGLDIEEAKIFFEAMKRFSLSCALGDRRYLDE
ncbi:hypothetical protein [Chlamydiifrater phoenicopteri]|uniref:hypothetical protein n=1 Tax=Chlamydiifrater phoenicopteri TaxID=2681469 RepID=UPI001BD02812|nr:hypothetical protein [Chlamydiifrater phoenicopteri]